MKNLKIRTSIVLSLLLPIVGLIAFSGSMVVDKRQTAQEMQGLEKLAKLAPAISAAVNELQTERGMAAVFITSKGKRFKDEYPAQFETTDPKVQSLIAAFHDFDASVFDTARAPEPDAEADGEPVLAKGQKEGEPGPNLISLPNDVANPLVEKMNRAIFSLYEIGYIRARVKRRFAKVLKLSEFYDRAIADLLAVVEQMGTLSSDARTTNAIIAYASFQQAKEYTGRERDIGATGFSSKRFKFFTHKRFVELIAHQEAILHTFRNNARPEQIAFMEQTVTGPRIEELENMRTIAIASSQEGLDLQGITPIQWGEAISAKIDMMKTVEDRLAEDLVTLVHTIRADAENAFMTLLTVTLALLGVTLVFVMFVVRNITKPVTEMVTAMNRLADGDLSIDVPARGRTNEIGEMSNAVQSFKDIAIKQFKDSQVM